MNSTMTEFKSIFDALQKTSKGKLEYDSNWKEEGRTQEIVDSVKQSLSTLKLSASNLGNLSFRNNIQCNENNNKFLDSNEKKSSLTCLKKNDLNKQENLDILTNIRLQQYELQRENNVLNKFGKVQQKLNENNETIWKRYEDQMRVMQKEYLLKLTSQHEKFEQDYQDLQFELENLKQKPKTNAEENSESCLAFILKQEQKQKEQAEIKSAIIKFKENIKLIFEEISQKIEEYLSFISPDSFENINQNKNFVNSLINDCEVLLKSKNHFLSIDVKLIEMKFNESKKIKDEIFIKLEEIEKFSIIQKNQSLQLQQENENKISEQSSLQSTKPIKQNETEDRQKVNSRNEKQVKIKTPRERYIENQVFLIKYEQCCAKFGDNDVHKKRRSALQIYIRTIINTICNVSIEHLKDKLLKLINLFCNKNFEQGGKQFKICDSDYSLHFSVNITVKFFLNVACKDRNISFKLAPVIIILWSLFSLFGQVFFAHLTLACPYTLPYYPSMTEETNHIDFLIVCGYQLDKNGKLENEDQFHSRMSALTVLYAAIIQSNLFEKHPQDIDTAWRWLALILNEKPAPNITALLLDSFLSMTSHKLYLSYGKQFKKMIFFIQQTFINEIEKVTSKTDRQTLMKLKSLLDSIETKLCKKSSLNTIVLDLSPEGLVPDYFFKKSFILMH